MRLIVADTSPIFYLLSIENIEVLPSLFGTVLMPEAVRDELLHPAAPESVRGWAGHLPAWVEVRPSRLVIDGELQALGAGEREAIALALSIHADMILIDERKGATVALSKGFEVMGTLGILDRAAERGLLDLADAFTRLKATNFRYRQEMLDDLLAKHKGRKEP
jgi:predicted nucleic acid-binding protein